MLAVLFAACYPSIHAFSHEHSVKIKHSKDSQLCTFKTPEKILSEKEACLVCDFKFAAFLLPEIVHYEFIPTFYEIPYQFNCTVACVLFEGNSNPLRGPPTIV